MRCRLEQAAPTTRADPPPEQAPAQCHGTKNLRRRPGYLRTRNFQIVDDPRDSYLCFYCGPNSQYDFNPYLDDDEQKAMQVQENLKLAVANVFPRPFESVPTAGGCELQGARGGRG
jgi:hypothetical protein